jgi:hypothetical protein
MERAAKVVPFPGLDGSRASEGRVDPPEGGQRASGKSPKKREKGWRRRPDLNRRVEVLQSGMTLQTNRLQTP